MVQKRCREEIMSQILEVCCASTCKTAIVYKTNLNFNTATPYLELLSEKGLIEADQGLYTRTSKGTEILENLKRIHEHLGP